MGRLPKQPINWMGRLPKQPINWMGRLPKQPINWMGGLPKQPINWMGAPKIYTCVSISLGAITKLKKKLKTLPPILYL